MNDLDKKIAELKGWTERNHGIWDHPQLGWAEPLASLNWSLSDAKAFELVDEMTVDTDFELAYNSRIGEWKAKIGRILVDEESGQSRAEAICRVYIARMAKKEEA